MVRAYFPMAARPLSAVVFAAKALQPPTSGLQWALAYRYSHIWLAQCVQVLLWCVRCIMRRGICTCSGFLCCIVAIVTISLLHLGNVLWGCSSCVSQQQQAGGFGSLLAVCAEHEWLQPGAHSSDECVVSACPYALYWGMSVPGCLGGRHRVCRCRAGRTVVGRHTTAA
jgi:hypothetical protein